MGLLEMINLGIVGACGRGSSFKVAVDLLENVRVHAVCDINAEDLDRVAKHLGAAEKYVAYEEMIEKSELDAVVVATPMQLHVPQAILALQKGIHVLSEVTAGVSVDECKQLVEACKTSSAIYMMAEDFAYTKPNSMVRECVQRGLFGVPYYAEGEYLHELKELNEITVWRRKWQTGIEGITYGTHSLGPILLWLPGDRVVSVCCAGSGHHYSDPRGDAYHADTSVMLCKMKSGALVKIRVDMISDRPHSMMNYQLQGTDGCYESARAPGERNRIWLRSMCASADEWLDLVDLEDELLPENWRTAPEAAKLTGHGGGDYFVILDFIESVEGKHPPTFGITEAMDMSLPGLVSQQSAVSDGLWLPVPDSRDW